MEITKEKLTHSVRTPSTYRNHTTTTYILSLTHSASYPVNSYTTVLSTIVGNISCENSKVSSNLASVVVYYIAVLYSLSDMAIMKLCMKQLNTEFVPIIVSDELQKGHKLCSSPIIKKKCLTVT